MRKILLLSSLIGVIFGYEGCGIDKKEALNNLSKTIYVNIENQFKKDEKVEKGIFNYFSSSVENSSVQTSALTLKNVKFSSKGGEVCAYISKGEVYNIAKQSLKEIENFSISDLSDEFEKKLKEGRKIISKIEFVKAILKLSSYQLKKLNTLEKQLKDLSIKGEVVFNVNIPTADIRISGKDKLFSPSKPILLNEGEYAYTITAPNFTQATGVFDVIAGQKREIKVELNSILDIQKWEEKVDFYQNSKEIDLSYGYATSNNKKWDNKKRIELKSFNNLGIYKMGWGISAGTENNWTAQQMSEFEFLIIGRVQFSELFNTKFSIGKLPVIPYIGAEGGFDLYNPFYKKGINTTSNDIYSILRGSIGTTILIHRQFGFNINFSRGFMNKKQNILSAGIVLDF